MADLWPFMRQITGVFSDSGRDQLPAGLAWRLVDYVPQVMTAGLRMRGRWQYLSPSALPAVPDGMLFAPYLKGGQVMVPNASYLHAVVPPPAATTSLVGSINPTAQNPVFHRDRVWIPDAAGLRAMKYVIFDGVNFTINDAPVSGPSGAQTMTFGKYACVWRDRVVCAAPAAAPWQLAFCHAGDPISVWDSLSIYNTALPITGLSAQRNQVLIFHDSSVDRLRGTTPAQSDLTDPSGDMILDTLFDRAGCYDARSLANWNDNIVFSDERGIFITDGGVVRNITIQGGLANDWRRTFDRGGSPDSICGVVHRDYYVTTVRKAGYTPTTFVIDLNTRRGFHFSNFDSTAYAFNVGRAEGLYGVDAGAKKVIDATAAFLPDPTVYQVDGNGTPVLPIVASAWELLSYTRAGRRYVTESGPKRIIDMHVSYIADSDSTADVIVPSYVNAPDGVEQPLWGLKAERVFSKRKVAVRRQVPGWACQLQQVLPTRDTRIYDVSLYFYPTGASRLERD
jgi:hypothetical protein